MNTSGARRISQLPAREKGLYIPGRPHLEVPMARKRFVPARQFSYGRHAQRVMDAKEYYAAHSDPSEHVELYTSEYDPIVVSEDPMDHQFPLASQQDYENIRQLNREVFEGLFDRPGPGLMSEHSKKVGPANLIYNSNKNWVENPEDNFTGFEWGSTYNRHRYSFDMNEAGAYDHGSLDRFPEMVLNVPSIRKDGIEYLEGLKNAELEAGSFRRPNRIRLNI